MTKNSVGSLDAPAEILAAVIAKREKKTAALRRKLGNMRGGISSAKKRHDPEREKRIYDRWLQIGCIRGAASTIANEEGLTSSGVNRYIRRFKAQGFDEGTLGQGHGAPDEPTLGKEAESASLLMSKDIVLHTLPETPVQEFLRSGVQEPQTIELLDELMSIERDLRKPASRGSRSDIGDLFGNDDWRAVFADRIQQVIERIKQSDSQVGL